MATKEEWREIKDTNGAVTGELNQQKGDHSHSPPRRKLSMVSTELQEQQALFQWAEMMKNRHPELNLLFHIGNERKCSPQRGRQLKLAGVKPGVPDICLPVKRGSFGALWIEMKRRKGSTTSPEQKEWHKALEEQGHRCQVCKGWEAARDAIVEYLNQGQAIP